MNNTVIYILYSGNTQKYYTGKTADFDRRLVQHNSGFNTSTKNEIPWIKVWNSELLTEKEAFELEKKIKKRGAGRFLAGYREK